MRYLALFFVCLMVTSQARAETSKNYIPPAAIVQAIRPQEAPKNSVAIPEPSAEAVEAAKNAPEPAKVETEKTEKSTQPTPAPASTNAAPLASATNAEGANDTPSTEAEQAIPASSYIKPEWGKLLQTMFRFRAIDLLEDDALLDDYALVAECDLYARFYMDDFKWKKVREAIRGSLKRNKDKFPLHYYKDVKVQLGRYNFEKRLYQFTTGSVIHNANTFLFQGENPGLCVESRIKYLPVSYRGVSNDPITIEGLSMDQPTAQTLLEYMQTSHNTDRILTARFNITVLFTLPLDRSLRAGTQGDVVYQQTSEHSGEVRYDVKIDSVDFYADDEKKIKVYTFVPK